MTHRNEFVGFSYYMGNIQILGYMGYQKRPEIPEEDDLHDQAWLTLSFL